MSFLLKNYITLHENKLPTSILFRDRDTRGLHERDISEWINVLGSLQEILQFSSDSVISKVKNNSLDEIQHVKSGMCVTNKLAVSSEQFKILNLLH